MISYAVENKINVLPLENVKLYGAVGSLMDIFLEKRVTCDFAKNEICGETIDAMREQLDDRDLMCLWRGEFWGKWAIGASRVYRYTHDEALKDHLISSTKKLLTYQKDNGYLNSYKNEDNLFAQDLEEVKKQFGWPCDWNWNVWCRKYTLWGLLEVYSVTNEEAFLTAAVKLANHLMEQLERLGVTLHQVGTSSMFGLPPMSIIKPFVILYRYTEDKKYLDFCIEQAKELELGTETLPELITIGMKKIPIFDWFEKVKTPEGITNKIAKIYEMLSLFDGLLELYRVTGFEKYFVAVKNCYDMIKEKELNVLFSIGYNDQFYDAAKSENALTESCDVLHWMRVSSELYKLTGDVSYIDDFERAFYNPFLAASYSDGNWSARAVRSSGRHLSTNQSEMKYSHCCTNNMPRGYMNAAETFVMCGNDTLFVNLYTDYKGCGRVGDTDFSITIEGDYFVKGEVKVRLVSKNDMRVAFRMPYWSSKTVIGFRDKEYTAAPGEYCYIDVTGGECVFDISFTMTAELREFDGEIKRYPDSHCYVKRYVDSKTKGDIQVSQMINSDDMVWDRRCTLIYGPLLLTRSLKCGNSKEEMFSDFKGLCGGNYSCQLVPEKPDCTFTRFTAIFSNGTNTVKTKVCDFASGTNEMSLDEKQFFSIWF